MVWCGVAMISLTPSCNTCCVHFTHQLYRAAGKLRGQPGQSAAKKKLKLNVCKNMQTLNSISAMSKASLKATITL